MEDLNGKPSLFENETASREEQVALKKGLVLSEDLGTIRVYRSDAQLLIIASNGFGAEYLSHGEINVFSDAGVIGRKGALEEIGFLMELLKMLLMRLTPEQSARATIIIYGGDKEGALARKKERLKMFSHFFKLTPDPDDHWKFHISLP